MANQLSQKAMRRWLNVFLDLQTGGSNLPIPPAAFAFPPFLLAILHSTHVRVCHCRFRYQVKFLLLHHHISVIYPLYLVTYLRYRGSYSTNLSLAPFSYRTIKHTICICLRSHIPCHAMILQCSRCPTHFNLSDSNLSHSTSRAVYEDGDFISRSKTRKGFEGERRAQA